MQFEAFRDEAFALALKEGCTAAEVYFSEGESFEVQILEQQVDSYSVNRSFGLGLRVQLEGRNGYAYTEALEDPATLVRRAMDNAWVIENTDEHPMQGACAYQVVTLPDDPVIDKTEAEKIALAMELERQAKACDSRVARVGYDLVATGRGTVRIENTLGLRARRDEAESVCYISPILEEGQEVHDASAFRTGADILDTAGCAREAVDEALCQFGGSPVEPGEYRVLLRYDAAADLLASFSSMFSADAAQKGLSLLAGREGQTIASPLLTVRDDPFYPLFPRAFDAEGVPSLVKDVVENGVLKTLLHNLKTAKKAGVASTSNAGRGSPASPVGVAPSNLYILPGESSYDELVALLRDGLVITEISGLHAGVNAISGEFSLLARGMKIEAGQVVRAVEQITVAGSFLELMTSLLAVGSDLKFGMPSGTNFGSSSLLFERMMVAGK